MSLGRVVSNDKYYCSVTLGSGAFVIHSVKNDLVVCSGCVYDEINADTVKYADIIKQAREACTGSKYTVRPAPRYNNDVKYQAISAKDAREMMEYKVCSTEMQIVMKLITDTIRDVNNTSCECWYYSILTPESVDTLTKLGYKLIKNLDEDGEFISYKIEF